MIILDFIKMYEQNPVLALVDMALPIIFILIIIISTRVYAKYKKPDIKDEKQSRSD